MKHRAFLMLFAGLACFVCTAVMAAMLICSKCGYENPQKSKFCTHCGVRFGQEKEATNSAAAGLQPDGAAKGPVLPTAVQPDPKIVDEELKAASAQLNKGNGWLALFYCENAMALNAICETNKNASERILQLHGKSERKVRSAVRECHSCGSAGAGENCRSCRGSGVLPGPAGLDALKYGYGNAIKQYAVLRQGAAWVPVGGAWVPQAMDGKLNYHQKAVLKRVAGSRCQDCVGFGQLSCVKCAGAGRLKCRRSGCVNGYVIKRLEGGFEGSIERTMRERCDVCGGSGALMCKDCTGYGCYLCKTCRGAGKLPVCQRCDGEGLKKCSDCKGTGMQKKTVCNACGGCGEVLCTGCMGAGRAGKS